MTQSQPQLPQLAAPMQAQQIRTSMRHIVRRQWWLWSSALMVTTLLTLGIASFAFPELLTHAENSASFLLSQAMHGLVGLVLLFNVYTIYQQLQIHRIQNQLSNQVEALGNMEARTEAVYKIALLDPLTGLYNRRSGEQRLAEELSRSERLGSPLTTLMLDLNGLKYVNDKFGHAAGDELIRHFASRLAKAIRGSDVAVRLGGDEFLLLLPQCKPEEVRHILNRLGGIKMELEGKLLDVTFSAGWSNYQPEDSPEEMLKRADDALYVNKRASKGQANFSTLAS